MSEIQADSQQSIDRLNEAYKKIRTEMSKVIVGQDQVIEELLIALFSRGHCLLEGVPGLAKTLMISTLARCLSMSFARIQFTPDLMPADITGTDVLQENRDTGEREFHFIQGPLFHNVVLADEINRTTPKTQSALLEAMSEGRVTADDETFTLPMPFMVIATQNPTEHHGTFPLPESQLDRFLMRIQMGYPGREDEKDILRSQVSYATAEDLTPVVSGEDILKAQELVRQVEMAEVLLEYLMSLVQKTRNTEFLELGVSTRGAMALYRASQALAFTEGRSYCIPDDLKRLVIPVFSHRILISPKYTSPLQGSEESESIIRSLVDEVEVPL
jgi:MoxR-like ATPase